MIGASAITAINAASAAVSASTAARMASQSEQSQHSAQTVGTVNVGLTIEVLFFLLSLSFAIALIWRKRRRMVFWTQFRFTRSRWWKL